VGLEKESIGSRRRGSGQQGRNELPAASAGSGLAFARQFVEEEVPYLPERLRSDLREVVTRSEIVVIANGSRAYREVGAMLSKDQELVDLVHAVDPATVPTGRYHGLAW